MAPEQVEGKETDERSDIFSFGVVFYEMITGQRPFTGDTQAAVLASLLKDQPPPMSQRQPAVPRPLERVVRKCLEKKPDDRWHSARDLKPTLELIDLDAPPTNLSSASASVPIPVQTPRKELAVARRWPPRSCSCWARVEPTPISIARFPFPDAIRFEIGLPGSGGLGGAAVSPDGRKLAFVARGADGRTKLWVRSLSTSEARPLDGTEGVTGLPFWSWDSRYIAFGADGEAEEDRGCRGTGPNLVHGGRYGGGRIVDPGGQDRVRTRNAGADESGLREWRNGHARSAPTSRLSYTAPSLLPDGKHFRLRWRRRGLHRLSGRWFPGNAAPHS